MGLYDYRVKVNRILDGDTVWVTIEYGLDQRGDYTLRFYGMNAPEKGSPEGEAAKAYLEQLLAREGKLMVHTYKDRREKFGRYLASLYLEEADGNVLDISQEMIKGGHAVGKTYAAGEVTYD